MPITNNNYRKLTPNEILNATLHHWPSTQKITNIPYSYDLSIIPQQLKDSARSKYSQSSFAPLNTDSINWLQKVLHEWEKSCENTIKFIYVGKISSNTFPGIVIANCDDLGDINGYWQQVFTSGQFQFGLVCIPSNYYDAAGKLMPYNIRTISHEIGHAIGLQHFHDVESIRVYSQNSPEGMGYSVMPYLDEIESDTNLCEKMDACLNTTYAVMPGPLDAQMCQAIYGKDSLLKPISLEEIQNYAFAGASIGCDFGARSAAEYLFKRLGDTQLDAHLKTLAIYYSVILLRLVYNSYATDYSSFFEQAQQLMIPLGSELCHLTLKLLGDYLRTQNLHVLSNTLEIASSSLILLSFSHGLIEAARGSFHATWNYGAAILSGIASYGIVSSIGKHLVNNIFAPVEVENPGVVEQTTQKGLLTSLWSFFGTNKPEQESAPQTLTSNKQHTL